MRRVAAGMMVIMMIAALMFCLQAERFRSAGLRTSNKTGTGSEPDNVCSRRVVRNEVPVPLSLEILGQQQLELGVVSSAHAAEEPRRAVDPEQPSPPPGSGPPGGLRFPSPPLIEALDVNGDGELDANEIAQAAARLKTLDKNGDGELTDDEIGMPFPGGPRGPGPGGGHRTLEVVARFDDDKDGMLNRQERVKARAYAKEQSSNRGGMFGRGSGGPGGPFGGRGPGGREADAPAKPGKRLSPDCVAQYPSAALYDLQILRTLFFILDNDDWEAELEDFRGTDVELPATLIVDGKTYPHVGLRFRGNTSLHSVPRGKKRPLNVSIDLVDTKQRLYGHRTLNLLNAHSDPSMLRTVLFDRIAGQYLPAPRANLVRVVFNGESWGIYVNEEQFNKDFAKTWFAEGDGARWRVPVNFSGAGALVYQGEKEEAYHRLYELHARDEKAAWRDLIALCRQLEQLPDDKLETELDRVLNVDRALWFLAVDNVLMDDDGYVSRGSDYCLYQDCTFGRFHLVHRDSNETFRFGGGPGGPGGGPGGRDRGPGGADMPPPFDFGFFGPPGGPGGGPGGPKSGATLDPLSQIDSRVRPVIRRLLSNPNLRARYLAHVRTNRRRVARLASPRAGVRGLSGLDRRGHVGRHAQLGDVRRLLRFRYCRTDRRRPVRRPAGHQAIRRRAPRLLAQTPRNRQVAADGPFRSTCRRRRQESRSRSKRKWAKTCPWRRFCCTSRWGAALRSRRWAMTADQERAKGKRGVTVYSASMPALPAGTDIFYYVEARAEASVGTTTFGPRRTELGAMHCRVIAGKGVLPLPAKTPMLVLNELMASNTRTMKSPRGKFDDWIELANVGKEEADLSGMHLTDDRQQPHKWTFPAGTKLGAGQFLLVWADDDTTSKQGLHANFKLSQRGETVLLIDSEARGSAVIDAVEFGPQRADVSLGRHPNGAGKWQLLPPTPGKANSNQ